MSSAEHKANAAATAARDAAIMLHTVMDSDDVTPETQAEAQYRLANAITYAQDAIDQLTHDETTCPWCGDISTDRLRQGHHEPRNLWEHHRDDEPESKSGVCVGRVDTPELAAEICTAVNAARAGRDTESEV